MLGLQIRKGVSYSRTPAALFMTIETANSTTPHSTTRTGILEERSFADITKFLAGRVFGNNELR
jgi:hypothetical protein